MEWLIFASLTAIGYGIFDLLVKQAAGKIEDGLSGLIINTAAITELAKQVIDANPDVIQISPRIQMPTRLWSVLQ